MAEQQQIGELEIGQSPGRRGVMDALGRLRERIAKIKIYPIRSEVRGSELPADLREALDIEIPDEQMGVVEQEVAPESVVGPEEERAVSQEEGVKAVAEGEDVSIRIIGEESVGEEGELPADLREALDIEIPDEQMGITDEQIRVGMRVQLEMLEQQLTKPEGLGEQHIDQIITILENPLAGISWVDLSSEMQQFLADKLPADQIEQLQATEGGEEETGGEEGAIPPWLLALMEQQEERGGILERFGRKVDRLFTKETLKRIGIFLKDTFLPRRGKDFLVWLCGAAGGFLTTTAIDYALAPIVIPVLGGIIRGQVKKAAAGGVMIVASRVIGSVLEKSYTRQAQQVREDFLAKMREAGGEGVQELSVAQQAELYKLLEKMQTDKADVVQALAAGWATGSVAATVCSITGLTDRAVDWIQGKEQVVAVVPSGEEAAEHLKKLKEHDKLGPARAAPHAPAAPPSAPTPSEAVAKAAEITGGPSLPSELNMTIHVEPGQSLWREVAKAVSGKVPSEWAGAAGGNGPDVVLTDAIVDHLQKEGVTSGTINLARVLDDEKTIGWFDKFFKIAKSQTGTAANYWRTLHSAHEALTATT